MTERMTLAEAKAIDAAWPKGTLYETAQAKAILTAHRDHSVGLPLDAGRHGARPTSAFAAWYNSYNAELAGATP